LIRWGIGKFDRVIKRLSCSAISSPLSTTSLGYASSSYRRSGLIYGPTWKQACDNNNNNKHDNVYGAVIIAKLLREFIRFIWWMWNGAKRPPTLRPRQTTRAVSLPVGCLKPHPPSLFITQLESWYSFYHPTEDRRLSRPRHCSKGAQPVPKAVYRSDVYDKHATAHGGIRTLVLSHHSQACYR